MDPRGVESDFGLVLHCMKFRAIEQSAQKFPQPVGATCTPYKTNASAKWLTWHGKVQSVERLKRIHDMFGLVPEDSAHMALCGIFADVLVPGIKQY